MNSTLTKKKANVKAERLYLGVDLGLDSNYGVIVTERGQIVDRFRFKQDRSGYDACYRRMACAQTTSGAQKLLVGMEPSNYMWKLLVNDLEQHGHPYRLVNAYTVKKHREGDQLDRSKDDVRDGYAIAELLRMGKYTQTQLLHGAYAELRTYAKLCEQLQVEMVRQKNWIWAGVGQTFPELRQVFKNLDSLTLRALLRQNACAAQIAVCTPEAFIQAVRKDFDGQHLAVVQLCRLHALAAHSVGLHHGLRALQVSLRLHLQAYETLEQQWLEVRKCLLEQFHQLPEAEWMLTLPGLGEATAANLLAELGDPLAYHSSAQWIKLAGTQPVVNASGRRNATSTPMSHKGRSLLRKQLFLACLRLIQFNPTFAAAYQAYQQRSHNPLNKMEALGVMMNKLLKILWALIHHRTRFVSLQT